MNNPSRKGIGLHRAETSRWLFDLRVRDALCVNNDFLVMTLDSVLLVWSNLCSSCYIIQIKGEKAEILWILMDPHILMDPDGSSTWIPMDPDGSSWIPMDPLIQIIFIHEGHIDILGRMGISNTLIHRDSDRLGCVNIFSLFLSLPS